MAYLSVMEMQQVQSSSHMRKTDDATFCCRQPLDVELHYTPYKPDTYGLKA